MGIADKFDAAKDRVLGKAEEAIGKITHDKSKVMEGKADQAKGAVKDKIADTKAHVKEDFADVHTDDTEGGSPIPHGI